MHTSVTARDIARWLEGDVTDPREIDRILQAIETDPGLAAVADLLSGDEDDPDIGPPHDLQLQQLVREQGALLQGSVLWQIKPSAPPVSGISPWQALLERQPVVGTLHGRHHGNDFTLPVALEPVAGDPERLALCVEWPGGTRPVSLIVGVFDYGRPRSQSWEIPLPVTVVQPERDRWRRDLQRAMEHSGVAAAASGRAVSVTPQNVESPPFTYELFDGGRKLAVWGHVHDARDSETVIAEVSYIGPNRQRLVILKPVTLQPGFDVDGRPTTHGMGVIDLPFDATVEKATVTIREASDNELPKFDPSQVSALLAAEEFVALPLTEVDGGAIFRVRYPHHREAFSQPNAGLFIRVALDDPEGDND